MMYSRFNGVCDDLVTEFRSRLKLEHEDTHQLANGVIEIRCKQRGTFVPRDRNITKGVMVEIDKKLAQVRCAIR